jgi:predicted RNA-binding protein with PUA-like domain
VVKEHYPDPTTDDDRWVVVDVAPVEGLKKPVTLEEIKNDDRLENIALIKQSRLSVMPLPREAFDAIVELGNS